MTAPPSAKKESRPQLFAAGGSFTGFTHRALHTAGTALHLYVFTMRNFVRTENHSSSSSAAGSECSPVCAG
ncbi:MAG: hypothetical protein DBY36_03705 [Clostridiales bacterium]|nr:MAG: hypothetical protein DBY36_03705 [Clostridiales bacterium]